MSDIRPMTTEDAEAVAAVATAAGEALRRNEGREPEPRDEEREAQFLVGMRRFVERDPAGAWVATDGDGGVIGMAEAIRRDGFWGLSMLFVHPDAQSNGLGLRLLDKTLEYAEGATVRMIMASPDPRALRRYSRAGLAIHPGVSAEGEVDTREAPTDLPGREGSVDDLDLVAAVDEGLRGSRVEDAEFILANGGRLEVIDDRTRRGFVILRGGRTAMLGATDDDTAALLLWRSLLSAEGKTELWALTAQQNWAVEVALAARLKIVAGGAMFVAGRDLPPGPWLPSGWYF